MHHPLALHVLDQDLNDKSPLAWHVLIKHIGLSFISLFLPAILRFEYGLSLSMIFLYEALYSIVALIVLYGWSMQRIARHGTVAGMMVGIVLFSLNFIVLYIATRIPWVLFLSPIFAGLYVAFFWMWYHLAMTMGASTDKHLGQSQVTIENAWIIASLVWPLIGWILADWFGPVSLYALTFVCLLWSCVPLLYHHRAHVPVVYTPLRSSWSMKIQKELFWSTLYSFWSLSYGYFVFSVLWPILLFTVLQTYSKVAVVSFFSGVIVIAWLRWLGKRMDTEDTTVWLKRFLHWLVWSRWWAWLVAGLTILTGFFSQIVFVFVEFIHKFTSKISDAYLSHHYYALVDKQKTIPLVLDMLFVRESAIHVTKIIACLALAGCSAFWPWTNYALILPLFLVIFIVPGTLHLVRSR